MQLKHMRKEIAQFLQAGQESIARIRVEHVIREQNIWAAFEILELFCEFVLARVPILESQKECPPELREAIASIIFAAPRCSEVPDLMQIKNMFSAKYGKEFVTAAAELRPDSGVNRAIIEKLSPIAPSAEIRIKVLKEIAKEYNVNWDSSATEAELNKKHEDLLAGSNQACAEATISQPPTRQRSTKSSTSNGANPTAPINSKPVVSQHIQAPSPVSNTTFLHTNEIQPSVQNYTDAPVSDYQRETTARPSDVLERARAAIAAAERATAAARAAAALANVRTGSLKLDGTSS